MELRIYEALPSTNTLAKEWARGGAPQGAMVIAGRQTAGRGRLGRSFFSPEGGLYMSLILSPESFNPLLLTPLAGVACCHALSPLSEGPIKLKWVNDVLLHSQKLGGILAERIALGSSLGPFILGIGLNLIPFQAEAPVYPEELRDKAISLRIPQGLQIEDIALSIRGALFDCLQNPDKAMEDYRRLCATLGQKVRFQLEGSEFLGIAREVDGDGALLVQCGERLVRVLAGEVTLRRSDGSYA